VFKAGTQQDGPISGYGNLFPFFSLPQALIVSAVLTA